MNMQIIGVFFVIASLAGCTSTKQSEPAHPQDHPSPLALGNLEKAHICEDIIMSAQPTASDLRAAQSQFGVKTVINLRRPREMKDFDEARIVNGLGMSYVNIPIGDSKTLTDDIFAEVRVLLDDDSRKPILIHCGSANRVGAVWYAYRVLDESCDPEESMVDARTVGLRSQGHIARTKKYVLTHARYDE